MTMRLLPCCLIFIFLFAAQTFADIYKCVSQDGVVKFSDEPCSQDAGVAFRTEDSMPFDEAIGNGSPYPQLPVNPSVINSQDILEHAKKIGRFILSGEYNNAATIHQSEPKGDGWRVNLYFGPMNQKKYTIEMRYHTFPSNKGMYVWLNTFDIIKEGQRFDPPWLLNAKRFVRKGQGCWQNKIDYQLPLVKSYD